MIPITVDGVLVTARAEARLRGARHEVRSIRPILALAWISIVVATTPAAADPQVVPAPPPDPFAPEVLETASGETIYRGACRNCHGADGAGQPGALLAFEEEVPDFTDCSFATREPDADWIGVAHEGGPVRGFSRMMPSFGEILSPDHLQRVMDYIRTMCDDGAWPRGELNFPRALLTEKAYPEDEWVLESDVVVEGPGAVMNQLVYEKRFGARSQFELVIPFGFREVTTVVDDEEDWVGGVGDVVVGVKRDMFHSLASGSIVALGGEIKLPTGDSREGFGGEATVFETFLSYGQALPADLFLQLQGVLEAPADRDRTDEAIWRGAFGRTFTEPDWGRAWTPMVEFQGKRELESGAPTTWDLVPQVQVTLNTRQHVALNVGALVPMEGSATRDVRLVLYLLWEWFDGGLTEGW